MIAGAVARPRLDEWWWMPVLDAGGGWRSADAGNCGSTVYRLPGPIAGHYILGSDLASNHFGVEYSNGCKIGALKDKNGCPAMNS
jgi:hypothetical protein